MQASGTQAPNGLDGLFGACVRLASGEGRGALTTVARRRGSLPMSATAKMLVTEQGARLGTVGGGCLEAEIIARAREVLAQGTPAISEHTLNAAAAGDYGLTCGGTAVMFIEPVFPDAHLAAVYTGCARLMHGDERGILATGIDWSGGTAKLLVHSGVQVGRGDARMASAALALDPRGEEPRFDGDVLLETIAGRPRLVVFGGGHVGARVAEAAAFAGWRVTIVDDRPEFSDATRVPFAEQVITADYRDAASVVSFDADSYVVVATRGHEHDAIVVDQLARRELRYLGMLGSRRKVALTWTLLESWGVDRTALDRVHAPVGLAIGADTPEEIAVSVVAEMIAARRARSGRRGGTIPPGGLKRSP